jgi:pilus assembly protein Flp/PilA
LQLINTVVTSVMARLMVEKEEGQTLVEYGLILALISIAAIAIMGTVGGNNVDVFNEVASELHS